MSTFVTTNLAFMPVAEARSEESYFGVSGGLNLPMSQLAAGVEYRFVSEDFVTINLGLQERGLPTFGAPSAPFRSYGLTYGLGFKFGPLDFGAQAEGAYMQFLDGARVQQNGLGFLLEPYAGLTIFNFARLGVYYPAWKPGASSGIPTDAFMPRAMLTILFNMDD